MLTLHTSLARCSARSLLIFSSSRISSAVSSSSSSDLCQSAFCVYAHCDQAYSSSLLSSPDPSESASRSLASSSISLLRFASGSSLSCSSAFVSSIVRLGAADGISSSSLTVLPLFFAKCAASACRSSARRSRTSFSASPPWPSFL
jgi:hypothetical protein